MNIRDTTTTLSVLSDPTRLRLLAAIQAGTLAVTDLASALSLSQPRVSHHLAVLLRAGLVRVRRDGTRAFYSIESGSEASDLAATALSLLDTDPLIRDDRNQIARQIRNRQAERRAFFADLAASFPETLSRWIDLRMYRTMLLDRVPPGMIAADLGCGPGWMLPDLARKCAKVIGVDHAPEVLSLARQTAASNHLTNCEFRLGELEHLPLSNGEVQVVILGLVLQHVLDPKAVIQEACRVLCGRGHLIVIETLRHEIQAAREELGELWMGFTQSEIVSWVTAAGFSAATVQDQPARNEKLGLVAVTATIQETEQDEGIAAPANDP